MLLPKTLPLPFYNKCAEILNERCIASKDININFYQKDIWNGENIKKHRSYCYSTLHQRIFAGSICPECQLLLEKIMNFELYEIGNSGECQEIITEINKLEEKLADAAMNVINTC